MISIDTISQCLRYSLTGRTDSDKRLKSSFQVSCGCFGMNLITDFWCILIFIYRPSWLWFYLKPDSMPKNMICLPLCYYGSGTPDHLALFRRRLLWWFVWDRLSSSHKTAVRLQPSIPAELLALSGWHTTAPPASPFKKISPTPNWSQASFPPSARTGICRCHRPNHGSRPHTSPHHTQPPFNTFPQSSSARPSTYSTTLA